MIITAFIMGFAGSLHCVGMCSPLVLTVSNLNPAATFSRLVYNLGRILTYGVLGAIVGTVGWMLPFAGAQDILSVMLGIGLLLYAILGLNSVRIPWLTSFLYQIMVKLKALFGKLLQRKNYASIFILGSLNGLLPCGLTFLALAYCLTLGSPVLSFHYMLFFGVGTLPVMLGLTTVFQFFVKRFNVSFKRVTTVMLFVSGCLLIARVFFLHQAHPVPEEQNFAEIILCR
jgi:sulfite exporter TauE/SafE